MLGQNGKAVPDAGLNIDPDRIAPQDVGTDDLPGVVEREERQLALANRQPGLLQRTMRLNKEPGKVVEGSGHLLKELLAGSGKLSYCILHFFRHERSELSLGCKRN